MKYVLDVNMCREPELKALLDSNNEIVVVNDFIVEIFKSKDPMNFFIRNTKIIKDYPDQIHISHDRGPLVRKEIKKCSPLNPEEIIDSESTTIFRRWLTESNEFNKLLPRAKIEAENRLECQKLFVEDYLRIPSMELSEKLKIEKMWKEYSTNNAKLLDDIKDVSINVMGQFLTKYNVNNQDCFRGAISIIYADTYTRLWRIADWSLNHGIKNVPIDKLANDGFDLKYVLTSAFFNEILTKEKWLKKCREDCVRSLV